MSVRERHTDFEEPLQRGNESSTTNAGEFENAQQAHEDFAKYTRLPSNAKVKKKEKKKASGRFGEKTQQWKWQEYATFDQSAQQF